MLGQPTHLRTSILRARRSAATEGYFKYIITTKRIDAGERSK
jgi:hypothetical protein